MLWRGANVKMLRSWCSVGFNVGNNHFKWRLVVWGTQMLGEIFLDPVRRYLGKLL